MERPQLLSDVLRAAARELNDRDPPAAVWDAVRAAHRAACVPMVLRHERLGSAQPARAPARVVPDTPAHAAADAPVHAAPDAPAPRARRGWAWSGVLACALLLVCSTLLMRLSTAPPESSADAGSGFMPLVSAERWNGATAEPTWLVRTELPRERLAALGLPYDPARAGERVRAELLMHESGEVLAVRFVR